MAQGHQMKKAIALLLILAILSLSMLAGCKGNADPTAAPTATSTALAPTEIATLEASATPILEATESYPLPMEGNTMTPVPYPTESE